MTSFSLEKFRFDKTLIQEWGLLDARHRNWPVVYVMNNGENVYVGESLNAEGRMRQHLETPEKQGLEWVRVVLSDRFNKSACLDLESYLIRMFAGDGHLQVLNRNEGIVDADYYDRAAYRKTFEEIFEELRVNEQLFTRTIPQIVNSDLFKLSPFKALNPDQANAVAEILEGLFLDVESNTNTLSIIEGNPGTGKTIVAIYLIKLLEDIRNYDQQEPLDSDSIFTDFFLPNHPELLQNVKVGLVVPQQSLRKSIEQVFKRTPGLNQNMVLSPFDVGKSDEKWDILLVDEAHRLNQRANQSSAALNASYATINEQLFGDDDTRITQLDWIIQQSRHVFLMLDTGQTVKPADLPPEQTAKLLQDAATNHRLYRLRTQMRIQAGQDYVGYIREILRGKTDRPSEEFTGYDLRFFDDITQMRNEVLKRNEEHGLSRLVAGFAWPWISKKNKHEMDIEIDGLQLRWNSTAKDWINARGSEFEVGSIHTVQGYDLNYAGVIVGKDLRFDTATGQTYFDRSEYFDKKGVENNKKLKKNYTDAEVLQYVRNVYAVLLTRGIRGTYVYVVDDELREHLRKFIPDASPSLHS